MSLSLSDYIEKFPFFFVIFNQLFTFRFELSSPIDTSNG